MIDLRCGRAEDILKTLPDACCDALVSDPPAGVSFMQKDWDGHRGGRDQWIAWLAGIMAEARRCVKPGGYALVWALPRTSHWTATALDDGGWRIIDIITHHFGQGFPKGKGQLKPASEHWILCRAPGPLQPLQIDACRVAHDAHGGWGRWGNHGQNPANHTTEPGSNGTTLGTGWHHPGSTRHEAGRWPPNTLFSHIGGPDGCQPAGVRRVRSDNKVSGSLRGPSTSRHQAGGYGHTTVSAVYGYADADGYETVDAWTCVDGCPIKALDAQAGPRPSGAVSHRAGATITDNWRASEGRTDTHRRANDNAWPATTGSASRFFPTFGPDPADAVPFRYQPKAPPSERRLADGTPTGHPTQKPAALAQWLASLICQPGGTILDPFAGVGSLGLGALRAGCHYLGIEQDAGYATVAQRRLDEEQEQQAGPLFAGVGTATAAAR